MQILLPTVGACIFVANGALVPAVIMFALSGLLLLLFWLWREQVQFTMYNLGFYSSHTTYRCDNLHVLGTEGSDLSDNTAVLYITVPQ